MNNDDNKHTFKRMEKDINIAVNGLYDTRLCRSDI